MPIAAVKNRALLLPLLLSVAAFPALAPGQTASLGVFEGQSEVGAALPAGAAAWDAASGVYTVIGSGENLWSTVDGFHFVWKKMTGDAVLTADVSFPETAGEHNPHRKAVLMFRQTLDADGVYADAAVHGSGLTALQYRQARGAVTQDIELNIDLPRTVRLEKRGDTITMFLSTKGEPLHQSGASIKMHFDGAFYAGIGVCAHQSGVVERATFAHLDLRTPAPADATAKKVLYSTLQTVGIEENFRRSQVLVSERGQFAAPTWSRDGKTILFTRNGKLASVPAEGGAVTPVDLGAEFCTGSHGFSPDGKWLAASCAMLGSPEVRIYVAPAAGGAVRTVTANPGSYFHSWSPDGRTILFTRFKEGSLNIYAIPAEGGQERALTTGTGVSDDPDYSPDGRYIYFNSDRGGGTMQIWRMKADGTEPEQMTRDERNNWTQHPSPDGKSVLILSYRQEDTGHKANKDVALRVLTPADGKLRTIVEIVGGEGTDNVYNWAPDGVHFAYASFQLLPE
ncbi:MAG: DPP IV N-terminal domain-containing protein [Terracidiphilus sp.]